MTSGATSAQGDFEPAEQRPWTSVRILKRVLIGTTLLAGTVVGLASILYATTDPLSDRREQRLAAAETWSLLDTGTRRIAGKPFGGSAPGPELLIVRGDGSLLAAQGATNAAVRLARSSTRSGETLVLVWANDALNDLFDAEGSVVMERVRRYLSGFLTAGADGVVIEAVNPVAPLRPRSVGSSESSAALNQFAELVAALRSVEPSLVVVAHAPDLEAVTARLADHVDGLLRFPTSPTAVLSAQARPEKQVIFRDWLAGKPLLLLTREGGEENNFAKTLDFLPRTRLP